MERTKELDMDVVLAALCAALIITLALARRERLSRQGLAESLAAAEARYATELEHLAGMALHDALTGLPNRVLLQDRLRHALQAQGRRGGHVGVLFVDLDGFKAVNDGYGHGVGDEVLATIASRLRQAVRAGDTPARLSGDEFVIVCEGVEDAVALAGAAARLEAAITAPIVFGDRTICLGASIGSVLYDPDPRETPSHAAARLVAVADSRMYDVKKARQLRLAEMGVLNQLAARSVPS